MDSQPARILLVASDPEMSTTLRTNLSEAGYDVTAIEQIDAALTELRSRNFDMVLVGLRENGSHGDSLLARRSEPRLQSVPLLALAPRETSAGTLRKALELGADDYLQEPFDPYLLRWAVEGWLERARLRSIEDASLQQLQRLSHDLQEVILPLGISLSTEKDSNRMLERILLEAKSLCGADAGTLYVRTKDERLQFSIMLTDSLGIALGGTTGKPIPFEPLRLFDPATSAPNHRNIATHVALTGQSVNISDIYGHESLRLFEDTGVRQAQQLSVGIDVDRAAEEQRRSGDRSASAPERAESGHETSGRFRFVPPARRRIADLTGGRSLQQSAAPAARAGAAEVRA